MQIDDSGVTIVSRGPSTSNIYPVSVTEARITKILPDSIEFECSSAFHFDDISIIAFTKEDGAFGVDGTIVSESLAQDDKSRRFVMRPRETSMEACKPPRQQQHVSNVRTSTN